jgi:chemotaxis protein methyltransferase CheR
MFTGSMRRMMREAIPVKRDPTAILGNADIRGQPESHKRPELHAMSLREFARIRQLAIDVCGMDFAESKRELIAARLDPVLRKLGLQSYEAYFLHVRDDASGRAMREFIDALATNHTSFLREADHFAFMRLKFGRTELRGRPLRIWSAACSTGEEPYSIAMTLLDQRRHEMTPGFQILASDISTKALACATAGVYARERLRDVPPTWLSEFFESGSGRWSGWMKVKKAVRDTIRFERFNLLDDAADFGNFDVIFCRNVMLYFNPATQEGIVNRMTERLNPGGYLFTGHTESLLGIRHRLTYVQPAAYRRAS